MTRKQQQMNGGFHAVRAEMLQAGGVSGVSQWKGVEYVGK
jgi:hypothetical protein